MHKDRKCGQNSLTEVVKAPEPSRSCATSVNSDQQPSASSPLRFSEFSIDELLVVEICAGSARLTKTCRRIRPQRLGGGPIQRAQLWHRHSGAGLDS